MATNKKRRQQVELATVEGGRQASETFNQRKPNATVPALVLVAGVNWKMELVGGTVEPMR